MAKGIKIITKVHLSAYPDVEVTVPVFFDEDAILQSSLGQQFLEATKSLGVTDRTPVEIEFYDDAYGKV